MKAVGPIAFQLLAVPLIHSQTGSKKWFNRHCARAKAGRYIFELTWKVAMDKQQIHGLDSSSQR